MLLANILISTALVIITSMIHFAGLTWLSSFLRGRGHAPADLTSVVLQGLAILFIVLMLFVLHSAEVWVYACAYQILGEFSSFEDALYFSATTFSTVGYGDLIISSEWRLLAALESMNGFLLIGWSTAFLVSVTAKVRSFEIDVEQLDD